jgi:ubiquinone biosynthesis protein
MTRCLLDGRRVAVKVLRRGSRRAWRRLRAVLAWPGALGALGAAVRALEPWPAPDGDPGHRAGAGPAAGGGRADELAEVMAADGYMASPKVVWDGVGKRVLTMEWAQGLPLSTTPAPRAARPRPQGAGRQPDAAPFLAQALDHGVFHADLHEGNLFVAAPAQALRRGLRHHRTAGAVERRYLARSSGGSCGATTSG